MEGTQNSIQHKHKVQCEDEHRVQLSELSLWISLDHTFLQNCTIFDLIACNKKTLKIRQRNTGWKQKQNRTKTEQVHCQEKVHEHSKKHKFQSHQDPLL